MDKRLGAWPELDNLLGRDLPVLHLLLLALPAALALVLLGHRVRDLLLAGFLHLWFDFCVDWLVYDRILGHRLLLLGQWLRLGSLGSRGRQGVHYHRPLDISGGKAGV